MESTDKRENEKTPYRAPKLVDKKELEVELQTNVLPDEPPPPM